MRAGRRFLLIGLLVAAAHVALALLLTGTGLAGYFLVCAAASVAVAGTGRRLLQAPRRGGSPPGPGDPPPGEGGPPPGDGGGDPEPPWWPDFEDAFRRHVRDGGTSRV